MSQPKGKGIASLLKYRYQKKDSGKLPASTTDSAPSSPASTSARSSSQASVSTPQGINGPGNWYSPPTTPVKTATDTVTDTPESQRPGPASPLFNHEYSAKKPTRFKRGVNVLASDSEDDPTSPVKACNTSSNFKPSSPWLSKEYGMKIHNGSVGSPSSSSFSTSSSSFSTSSSSQSQSTMSASSQSQSQSQSQRSLTPRDREKYALVTSLQEMFPDKSRELAEAALDNTASFDKAIDYLIGHREPPKKRKRIMSSQSSDGESPDPKRARQLSYESQDGTPSTSKGAASNGLSPSTSSPVSQKIDFLAEAFPGATREVLKLTLEAQNGSVELASLALSTFSPGTAASKPAPAFQPQLISPTENVGSIKAFKAARAQARQFGPDSIEVSDDEDEDGGDVLVVNGQVKKGLMKDYEEDEDDFDDEDLEREELEEEANFDPILRFFNDATLEELVSLSGCSQKKASVIVQIRPFEDWNDLASKFESQSKVLSLALVSECKEIIRIRDIVRKLMERCEKMTTKMQAIVCELTSKTTMEDLGSRGSARAVRQPTILNSQMKLTPYQMVGLNWLMLMHQQHLNGILGDEMGLGKTIQTIAFLAQMLQDGDVGPHLIIVPSSTIDNWLRELKMWCPDLKVILYYGSQEERRDLRYQLTDENTDEFHVVLTSYNIASGSVEDRVFFKKIQFHYAVFDEGHMLKNMDSRRYQSLMKMKAERRLLLTGTPLQNNLLELMSLLCFVMPDMFVGKTGYLRRIFTSMGSNKKGSESRGTYEQQTIAQAKRILKPFFLRRLKSEVLQQLPKKKEILERVPLAFEQQDLYDDLRQQFAKTVKENKDNGVVLKGQAGASMLMQLRKAANHHLLHRRQFDDTRLKQMAQRLVESPSHQDANVHYVFEDMQVMSDFELTRLCQQHRTLDPFRLDQEQITDSGKFRFLDALLPQMKSNKDRVLLFSQFTMMLDVIELYMQSRGHRYIRLDGQTPVAERQELIDKYNNTPEIFVFLLSTRAGGLGINLTAANKVILHDIDFNPYNDKQAEDRCHRVGQSREVTVYRMIAKNTVEEAMLRCAETKLRLEQDVTGSGKKDSSEATPSDVASLLQAALSTQNTDD